MTISTIGIGAAVTPTVIETWCSHYLNRKPRKHKPTAHISYDVGLNLVRRFLTFAATQTVDDVQAFTSQWVPAPTWVRTRNVDISDDFLSQAASYLQKQLGPGGLELVGGKLWWQWRPEDHKMRAEWIEMKRDYQQREKSGAECKRCMFYIHGGAYYFGSVDEHRYQIQRHARKLQARVLAPRYRLGPQYPFPCGLMDCLAAYLYLLTQQPPETIVLAGDSAGGGMATSLMIVLRDLGLPLPAGAILLSPWVDLTHSFPSCANDNTLDYVPSCGFMHRPSMSWPPPNSDAMQSLDDLQVEIEGGEKISAKELRKRAEKAHAQQAKSPDDAAAGAAAVHEGAPASESNPTPGVGRNLSIVLDGKKVEIKDQIQMYADNTLISHPLVSPVLQPSLGGLPPICVLVGGGEMLRDEQIYLAHKAANPAAFPPPSSEDRHKSNATATGSLVEGLSPEQIKAEVEKWPATYVQLQVWDDLCHVAPTLSFTRPAKFMYRSVAQFGAWALARAQKSEIRILDDDEVSIISEDTDSGDEAESSAASSSHNKLQKAEGDEQHKHPQRQNTNRPATPKSVGRAGDPLPLFKDHMIRHRVTRHGELYALESPSELAALTMSPQNVGNIKTGPVRKWLAAQEQLAKRFGDLKLDIQQKRLGELAEVLGGQGAVFAQGHSASEVVGTEFPPPCAWAGRSKKQYQKIAKSRAKRRVSRGLAMWSGWGSKHDEEAIENEEDKIKNKEDVTMSVTHVRNRDSVALDRQATAPAPAAAVVQKKEKVDAPSAQSGGAAGGGTTTKDAIETRAHDSTTNGSAAKTQGMSNGEKAAVAGAAGPATAGGIAAATTSNSKSTLEPVTSSQYAMIPSPDPESVPGTAPFKLARGAQHNPSTTTLMDQDGTLPASSPLSAVTAGGALAPGAATKSPATTSNRDSLVPPSNEVSRPSTALSSDAEVLSAQAVSVAHVRNSSRAETVSPIMSRGRFESGVPDGAASLAPTLDAEAAKRSSWAESTIEEVRLVGSRDGPAGDASPPNFVARFDPVAEK